VKSGNPLSHCANRRALTACVLSFAILVMPFAQLAAATRGKQRPEIRDQRSDDQTKNVATDNLFVNPLTAVPGLPGPRPEPAPQPAPPVGAVTATMTAALTATANNGDGKADPGDTINYTVTLGNTTLTNANGLSFNDILDSHTAFVAGSIKSTPVAFDQSFPAFDEDPGIAGVTITLQGQDPDGDLPSNAFSIVGGSGPSHGTLEA